MYDGKTGFLVKNPLDRYLITSRMLPDLIHNDRGSLTIYIQHQSPGKEKESNWLPAPDGEFYMIMRLYWPKPEALDGTWTVPPVEPVSKLEKTVQTPAGMIDAETITEAYIYLLGRALVIRQEHPPSGVRAWSTTSFTTTRLPASIS